MRAAGLDSQSGSRGEGAEEYLRKIEKEENFEGLLSCYLCRLWQQNNFADISKVRLLLRAQEDHKSELMLTLTSSANDWEVLNLILPHALNCCLESGDEDALLDVLHIPELELNVAHVHAMAAKNMNMALLAVPGHTIGRKDSGGEEPSPSLLGTMVLGQQSDLWTFADVLQLLLKRNVEDSALAELLKLCQNYDETVVGMLLRFKKEKLALSLVGQKDFAEPGELLSKAIDRHCHTFALVYAHALEGRIAGDVDGFFARIVDRMRSAFHLWPYYIYLLKVCVKSMPVGSAMVLLDCVMQMISSDTPETTFVLNSINPLKLCVCLYELMLLMGNHLTTVRQRCYLVCQDLSRLAVLLSNELQDEEAVVELYRDVDFEGRDVITICCKLGLTDMFLNKHVERLANDVWNGSSEEFAYFFQSTSSLFDLATFNFTKANDYERVSRFSCCVQTSKQRPQHRFQYTVWKSALHFRYLLEALSAVIIATMFYSLTQGGLVFVNDFLDMNNKCNLGVYCPPDFVQRGAKLLHKFVDIQDIIFGLSFVIAFLFLEHIVKALYTYLRGTKIHIDYALLLIDLAIAIVTVIYTVSFFPGHQVNHTPVSSDEEFLTRVFQNMSPRMGVYLSILVVLMILRALLYFRVSSFLGPFISSMQIMVVSVWQFAIVYITALCVFALAFSLLNTGFRVDMFDTLQHSLLTLFQAALGVYDMNQLPDDIVVRLMFVLFLVVCAIMLLNILIAILTQAYDSSRNKGAGIYLAAIFNIREIYGPDPAYEYLTHSFFPFSVVICVICAPLSLLLSSPHKEKLNKVVLRIEYNIAFVIALTAYLVIELLLYPVAYLKCLLHKMLLLCMTSSVPHWRKALEVIIFLILGPAIIFGDMLLDVWRFAKQSCRSHESEVHPSSIANRSNIPYSMYMRIVSALQEERREKVSVRDLSSVIRGIVEVNVIRLVTTGASKGKKTAAAGVSKVFILSSLLNLISSAASTNSEGVMVARPKTLLHLLLEALTIPRLNRKFLRTNLWFKKHFAHIETQPLPTSPKHQDRELSKQSLIPPSMPKQKEERMISLRLARWHNNSSLTQASLYFPERLRPISTIHILSMYLPYHSLTFSLTR